MYFPDIVESIPDDMIKPLEIKPVDKLCGVRPICKYWKKCEDYNKQCSSCRKNDILRQIGEESYRQARHKKKISYYECIGGF